MVDATKEQRIEWALDALERQGWLVNTDLRSKKLTRSDIEHFRSALIKAENLLAWILANSDKYGTHRNDSALIVQTLARLNIELGRIQSNVHSPLLYQEESTRLNAKGSDPAVKQLITQVGLYARHFSSDFPTPAARNKHLCELIKQTRKKASPSGIALWIARFDADFSGRERRRDWSEANQWLAEERDAEMCRLLTPPKRPDRGGKKMLEAWKTEAERSRQFWRQHFETGIKNAAIDAEMAVGADAEVSMKRKKRLGKTK